SNNIGSDGAKAVASEIAKCTNLSTLTLNLRGNNLKDETTIKNLFGKNISSKIKI
ncbi:hypothetical protein ABPG73_023109, partial [Tetrahymena malaccensis]